MYTIPYRPFVNNLFMILNSNVRMKNIRVFVFLIFYLFFSEIGFSQKGAYGIKLNQPYSSELENCNSCNNAFDRKIREVQFSIKREGTALYYYVNDKDWFISIFRKPMDGMAIDVVAKERYDCETKVSDSQLRGKLLKPIYFNKLKEGIERAENGYFRIHLGEIPDNLIGKELEYNILFIGNRTLCRYQTIFNLQAYNWDLLDMGMYLDSVSYENKRIGQSTQSFKMNNKTMRFVIPFQKNKSNYEAADIKPLYDSLNLNDFDIKAIDIKAYASVEGSAEHNEALQKQRANSIVAALQHYQKPTIKTKVSTAENWVEFINDITFSEFGYLRPMTKSEVKNKLTADLAIKMEPILKNHRKAIINLELVRKDYFESKSEDDLVDAFNVAIRDDRLEEATKLQNALFSRLKYFEVSPDILDRLEVPEQLKYTRFLNNRSAYMFQLDDRRILMTKAELESLKKLDKNNKRINYNLVAIKFKIWRFKIGEVDKKKFLSEINNLKSYGVQQNLIDRMLINFHIIKSENDMQNKDYDAKNESVQYIYDNYSSIQLSDTDTFSLAQFLAYYANIEWAANLLDKNVRSISVDEDLLFYYLNLTLINSTITKSDEYRTIMLNASTLNKERYCNMFDSPEKNGVTFQLLEDPYLRRGYCEICR